MTEFIGNLMIFHMFSLTRHYSKWSIIIKLYWPNWSSSFYSLTLKEKKYLESEISAMVLWIRMRWNHRIGLSFWIPSIRVITHKTALLQRYMNRSPIWGPEPISLTLFHSQFTFSGYMILFLSQLFNNVIASRKFCIWLENCAAIANAEFCRKLLPWHRIISKVYFHLPKWSFHFDNFFYNWLNQKLWKWQLPVQPEIKFNQNVSNDDTSVSMSVLNCGWRILSEMVQSSNCLLTCGVNGQLPGDKTRFRVVITSILGVVIHPTGNDIMVSWPKIKYRVHHLWHNWQFIFFFAHNSFIFCGHSVTILFAVLEVESCLLSWCGLVIMPVYILHTFYRCWYSISE